MDLYIGDAKDNTCDNRNEYRNCTPIPQNMIQWREYRNFIPLPQNMIQWRVIWERGNEAC
jgi:hypothetical protein